MFKHKEHAEPVSDRNVLFLASWIPAASRGPFPASERAAPGEGSQSSAPTKCSSLILLLALTLPRKS